ncbi:MarR family protein [Salinivirga cyanobacteriivorans]|uniref:MarR family protein n=1 Tax=Salinivirga cyanobacteriivorans TaxID=1307839 RepID=A0A0S2I0N1_9BACT|nr:MarR family transcriptional regulator [Salinivirga cyanobacteriivorans]ALO15841.1 MarR family protein [Salinivirga cyanobacteriivorans]
MDKKERLQLQKDLIETIGRNYEQDGLQPVAARISALLMVMDKEEFTFDEIVDELQVSKSSASVGLKVLQARNMIEYITYPGDRKRYFRIRILDSFHLIDEFRRKISEKKEILSQTISLKEDPNSRNSQFFKSLIKMTDLFLDNYEKLKEQYLKNM